MLKRDPFCTIRGPKCTGISTTVDHIVPPAFDPSRAHDLTNLRGACGPCNYGRRPQSQTSHRNTITYKGRRYVIRKTVWGGEAWEEVGK